jgi:Carboxypeptidase regulatory-like domain
MNIRPLCLAVALLFATSVSAQSMTSSSSSAGSTEQQPCTVSGMVVKLAGSEPLRKATLTLRNADDRTRSVTIATNSDGSFTFKGIDAGRYQLKASRVGYVTAEYGQRKPNDPGAVLTLRPGQNLKGLLFRLIPAAVISGRILDEDGEVLPGVEVSAVRQVYSDGKRGLSTSTIVETNDLGEYRLFGLPPGRYFISAFYPRWSRAGGSENFDSSDGSPSNAPQGYAKMYYPGTPDATQANAIVVRDGEEIPSIDMLMRHVLVHHIRGHVYNQITHKPGVGTNMFLTPKATGQNWEIGGQQTVVEKQDGSFEISEVTPGSYVLISFWFDEGKTYSTTIPLEVGSADIEGLTVAIGAGVTINGQIIWEGKPSLDKDELYVSPRLQDSPRFFENSARVSPTNSFTLKDIGDGTYHAEVSGQSKDCYIKDVRYGPSPALDDGFPVSKGAPANLEITISSRGARLQGTVSDADGLPAAGVRVALVPDLPRRSQHRLYKSQTTDQYGHFDLRGIAPGDYSIFGWDQAEDGAWEDSEFLKPFERQGQKLSLQEADQKSVNVISIKAVGAEEKKPPS